MGGRQKRSSRHLEEAVSHGKGNGKHSWILTVFWIAVNALPLSFSPADTPCAVASRCGNGNNAANIVFPKVCEFKDKHAAHGPSYDCRNLLHTQIV